jgi:hypothetical protein
LVIFLPDASNGDAFSVHILDRQLRPHSLDISVAPHLFSLAPENRPAFPCRSDIKNIKVNPSERAGRRLDIGMQIE